MNKDTPEILEIEEVVPVVIVPVPSQEDIMSLFMPDFSEEDDKEKDNLVN